MDGRASDEREIPPQAQLAAASAALAPRFELFALFLLSAVTLFVWGLAISDAYAWLNVAGSLALASILGGSALAMARASPLTVWAPLFWFRVACAVYCGFGSVVPALVDAPTLEHIFALHYFSAATHLKINLIYALGILATLSFARLFLRLWPPASVRGGIGADGEGGRTLAFALLFLLVGGLARYGIALPYTFGLLAGTVPGMILTLAKIYYAGIYLLIVQAVRPGGRLAWLALALIAVDIAVSIAAFAKTELLLVLIFAFLGLVSRKISLPRVAAGAACVLLAYFAFQPLVGYGRGEIEARTGTIRGVGLGERLAIVGAYLGGGPVSGMADTRQRGLARLSYVAVGAFVVDRYDAGLPGDTLRDAGAALVPRVLWPEKPVISGLGAELNLAVFGHARSSLGVGHFAEAYWNFGWSGLLLLTLPLAAILALATRFSLRVMAARDWLLLPVVLLGVNMGLRVDGHFVPDILGPAWMALLLAAAIRLGRLSAGPGGRVRAA